MKKLAALFIVLSFLVSCNRDSAGVDICADELGCIVIPEGEPIRIGVIQDLTGSASIFGNIQYRAIILALENRGNTLLDHPVEIVLEDEGCTKEGGKNAAISIASTKGVAGVLGTTCSGGATTASQIISDSGLVMISGSNSAASLTSKGIKKGENWQEGYYRTATNDSYRSSSSAKFAYKELGIRRVVTIDDGDSFTKGAVEVFSEKFESLGGEILFYGRVDKGDENMKPLLDTIARFNPEMIFIPLFPGEGISIINHLRGIKELDSAVIMASSSMVVEEFLNNLKNGDPVVFYAGSVSPQGENLSTILDIYQRKYNELPTGSFTAAYDATNILLDSIEKVSKVGVKGEIIIPKKGLRNELYSLKNYNGITGQLSCTEFGDMGVNRFKIYKVEVGLNGDVENSIVYDF